MKRLIPILLALMACSDPDDVENGTVVGNPGETAFRMAEGDGFETVGARVGVESMVWEACDGTLQEENVEQVIELTDEDQAFATPNGVWCAAALVPYESVELDIAVGGEDRVTVVVDVDLIEVWNEDGFEIDGDQTVFELGNPGWLSVEDVENAEWIEEFEDDDRSVVVVDDGVAFALAAGSGLFADTDGDGFLADNERTEAPLAAGDAHPSSEEDPENDAETEAPVNAASGDLQTGGGCGRSDSKLVYAFLLPVMGLGRRRFRAS